MELAVEGNESETRVRIKGELVAAHSENLRESVLPLAGRCGKVVLDLKETSFVDTSGLGVLIGLKTHLAKHGCALRLENPNTRVMQVLRMTRLAMVFGLEKAH